MTGFLAYRKNNKAIITAAGSNTPTTKEAKILNAASLLMVGRHLRPLLGHLILIKEFYGHGCEITPQRRARVWGCRTDR